MRTSVFCFFGFVAMGLFACSFDVSGLDKLPKGCGNGVLEEGEACDDGNLAAQDGCDASCTVEGGWNCTAAGCIPICGDGRMVGMEQCDDGDLDALDGCDAECRVEPGWYCEDAPSACTTRCGDGVRAGQEVCDDGNLDAQDGCNDLCRVEPGFSCEGAAPTVCSPVCGDNRVVGGEVCDGVNLDGNTCQSFGYYQGTLGCMSDCLHFDKANCVGYCGDGILDAAFGETCDTNAFDPADTCISSGYPGGTLTCSASCELDFASCRYWLEVEGGDAHTCALRSDGSVWCWGYNGYGQLGQPAGTPVRSPVPMQVLPSSGAVATSIAAGYNHSCAVLLDKTLWCWGANGLGQLGNGQWSSSSAPVQVKMDADRPLENVSRVSAGDGHTCALTDAGAVYCWGTNVSGQLGDGTTVNHTYAAAVPTLASGVSAISAGKYHTCALKTDGSVWCWGSNMYGQVGVQQIGNQLIPGAVDWSPNPTPAIVSLSCGEYFTCVASGSGNAYCFGQNTYGQLGNGQTTNSSRPVAVSLTGQVKSVVGGSNHACAVLQSGRVQCWGYNIDGQLGDGTQTQQTTPVPVSNLAAVEMAGAGRRHTCAIENGKLFCWGGNSDGQVGDNSYTMRMVPVLIDNSGM